jgi:two-component system alkaline phosphatase synthesis response regulator PhoP
METILLIDDNDQMLWLLRGYLEKSGYAVLTADNGKEGLDKLKENPDLVSLAVVDFNMPELDGAGFCQAVRNEMKLPGLPVIMMTARGSIDDKLHGYNSGADDYLVKPFEPVELVLRIESLLKRRDIYRNETPPKKPNKNIEVDRGTFSVTVKGKKVNLSPTEFDLFFYLFENANIYISADKILENVFKYPPGVGSPETVRSHIRNLRIKLEEEPGNPKIITSLLKRGYMLNTIF